MEKVIIKKITCIIIIISVCILSSCKVENYEIATECQANFLWLEGWLTYCTMMEIINNPNDPLNEFTRKFFPDSTRIDSVTKKMLEKELDKKRKYTLYKYLLKIEGEFIPIEDLIEIEVEE